MMYRVWLVVFLCSACSAKQSEPITLNIQPATVQSLPDIHVDRPLLIIHTLSDEQRREPGTLAKAYAASIRQLINYAEQLEQVIDHLQQVKPVELNVP